jgi:hypothetical protein
MQRKTQNLKMRKKGRDILNLSLHIRQFVGTCSGELAGRNRTCLSVAEPDVATLLIPKLVNARDFEPVSGLSLPFYPSPLFSYGESIRGSNAGWGNKFFSFVELPDGLWGPFSLQFSLPPPRLVTWSGCEFDFSPQSTAKIKNHWSYTFALPIYLHAADGDSFVFFIFLRVSLLYDNSTR